MPAPIPAVGRNPAAASPSSTVWPVVQIGDRQSVSRPVIRIGVVADGGQRAIQPWIDLIEAAAHLVGERCGAGFGIGAWPAEEYAQFTCDRIHSGEIACTPEFFAKIGVSNPLAPTPPSHPNWCRPPRAAGLRGRIPLVVRVNSVSDDDEVELQRPRHPRSRPTAATPRSSDELGHGRFRRPPRTRRRSAPRAVRRARCPDSRRSAP